MNTDVFDRLIRVEVAGESAASHPDAQGSVVYFLLAEKVGRIKIGWSNDLAQRLRTLATASACPLRLLFFVTATRGDEAKLHQRFLDHRTHGEWFDLEGTLRATMFDIVGELKSEAPSVRRVLQWLGLRSGRLVVGRLPISWGDLPKQPAAADRVDHDLSRGQQLGPIDASHYLERKHGVRSAVATLAKWRSIGGGPAFRKAARSVLYDVAELDRWAMERLGPLRRSTSDLEGSAG